MDNEQLAALIAQPLDDEIALGLLYVLTTYYGKRRDECEADSVDFVRYNTVANKLHSARRYAAGELNEHVKHEMERSKRNSEAHWELSKLTGNMQLKYLPEWDYVKDLEQYKRTHGMEE
jgi:hypothetical protein